MLTCVFTHMYTSAHTWQKDLYFFLPLPTPTFMRHSLTYIAQASLNPSTPDCSAAQASCFSVLSAGIV